MRRAAGLFAGVALTAFGAPAFAQDAATEARIQALEAQLSALQDQIADLKASTAANEQAIRDEQHATTISIEKGKPTIASGDGQFSATFHGVMQLDTAQYFQDKSLPASVTSGRDLNSGTNFRRGRFGVDGKLFGDWDYNLLLDFGGSGTDGSTTLHELWIQYSGFKPFKFRVGAFAPNLGLEDAASTNGSLFPERPSSAEVARSLAGADKRIGAQVLANGDHWLVAAAVTGAKAADAATLDEQVGYTFRVAGTPFYGYDWRIHLGANASLVTTPAQTTAGLYQITLSDRPELRVDGTQLVSTGGIDADSARHWGLEAAAQKKNLLIQGEYFDYTINRRSGVALPDPNFHGWYVEGGWVVTGEARKYNSATAAFDAPAIDHPFDLDDRGWGAWEVVGRYSVLDLNDEPVRGGEQTIWSGGVNWFPNSAVKFSLHYLDVSVDRLNGAGQQAGQDYQAVNLRSQFAF
jgi:phosphate-selective porin OprO/OprP